jgi:hypothetical protein
MASAAGAEDDLDFDFVVSYNNSSYMALSNAAQDKSVRSLSLSRSLCFSRARFLRPVFHNRPSAGPKPQTLNPIQEIDPLPDIADAGRFLVERLQVRVCMSNSMTICTYLRSWCSPARPACAMPLYTDAL